MAFKSEIENTSFSDSLEIIVRHLHYPGLNLPDSVFSGQLPIFTSSQEVDSNLIDWKSAMLCLPDDIRSIVNNTLSRLTLGGHLIGLPDTSLRTIKLVPLGTLEDLLAEKAWIIDQVFCKEQTLNFD